METGSLGTWEDRLAPIVSRKLGCPNFNTVTFRGFTRTDKFGAVTPIFTMPEQYRAEAERLGLLVA